MSVDAREVLANLEKLDALMHGPAMKTILGAAAIQAQTHVQENAREEFYTGSRPYTRTGNLLNSIQTDSNEKESVVFVGADYGVYLEMGTSRGITARHYVKRGVAEHLSTIREAATIAAKRALKL